MATILSRVTAKTAFEICRFFELSEAARPKLTPVLTPGAYLDLLVEAGCFIDAVRLLAYALGRREAVWWACVCVRATPTLETSAAVAAALKAAEAWVYDPKEENRRAAGDAANVIGMEHAAGCAAWGAFWSGGSMAPATVKQVVPPGPLFTARAVAGAVMIAAVSGDAIKANTRYRDFISRAVDIANGGTGAPKAGA